MKQVLGGFSLVMVLSVFTLPANTFAAAESVVGQRITITAEVKENRYVIVDETGTIQLIISNNNRKIIEPEVYIGLIAPENLIATTQEIRQEVDTLLEGKIIKPGTLYDRKKAPLAVERINFIELLTSSPKVTAQTTYRSR